MVIGASKHILTDTADAAAATTACNLIWTMMFTLILLFFFFPLLRSESVLMEIK